MTVGNNDVSGVAGYGNDPYVQARVIEYCGGSASEAPTAAYLATLAERGDPFVTWDTVDRHDASDVVGLLSHDLEVARSLWDTRSLLFLVDLDHLRPDAPAEPFLHPADVFVRLEPVYRVTTRVLGAFGIRTLPVMTGRGYHFIGAIDLHHPVVDRLAALRPSSPSWLAGHEARCPQWQRKRIDERHARAAEGLGLLTEYVAHQIVRRAARTSPIPVTVNGTVVGQGRHGRECVSVDFSHAGDPLDSRYVRVAFGPYGWHRSRPDLFGEAADCSNDLVALPRGQRPLIDLLIGGRTREFAQRLARHTKTTLPYVSRGIARLIEHYESSTLCAFHREFEAGRDRTPVPIVDLAEMPPCVSPALSAPNDLLLKPEHLQHLTRWLLSRGWSARQIAELVRSEYEADHGWGRRWAAGDTRTRAEFDVRVFAGMVATGLDRMIDFNCTSAKEKYICPMTGCRHDLRRDRERGLARAGQ